VQRLVGDRTVADGVASRGTPPRATRLDSGG